MIYKGNCRNLLRQLRYGLNEYTTGLLNGTDTSGKFQNEYLLDKINRAQGWVYAQVFARVPSLFLASTTLTAVDSVLTLPWDFSQLRWLKDSNGYRVFPTGVDNLHLPGSQGSSLLYYRQGRTLVIDKSSSTDTYTLYYYKRMRDLTAGMSSAGGAGSLTLATSASKIADYYNNMTLEDESDDFAVTVTDYSTARVASFSTGSTGAASKYYGIVSELPEEFHDFIVPRALMQINAEFPANVKAVTAAMKTLFDEEFAATLMSFAGPPKDIDTEEIFTDFGPDTRAITSEVVY